MTKKVILYQSCTEKIDRTRMSIMGSKAMEGKRRDVVNKIIGAVNMKIMVGNNQRCNIATIREALDSQS